ncbi:hypothetical protein LUZ63_015675 [Rhynchospora breviuscula]|uniref:Reverse transcriptase domain-containing protein n=1 Tax=Rhynchospora breviuscula TaxID=2022672 RepID=A0A9Q0CD44_9POAL|nr:hypothetical protein LUZ63_015675 [Rhynchospora breviuscula]
MRWHQRARVKWLRYGDQNTRFFHAMASAKMRNKFVSSLQVQGRTVSDPHEILSIFHRFYSSLLGTEACSIDYNPSVLYRDDSLLLSSLGLPFTELEIQRAVMGLSDNKACGPDGIPNEFFKIHWDLVKNDLMEIFDSLSQHKLDLSNANVAHLILLPKKEDAQEVLDFRPISIVSYLPKLISKVLSNRLVHFLPSLISPSQTGFIKGRIISENFNTAREMIFNISKSAEPGFPHNFLCWIELLFNSSSSSLLVNGLVGATFKHQRGLRQGDPISPSLFLLAADVLTKMMQAVALTLTDRMSSNLIDPYYLLQYADDTLIFSTAKGQAPRSLVLVLDNFSKVSGMALNLTKSSFVPFNLPDTQVESLQDLLHCSYTTLPVLYLGLPLTDRRPDRATFQLLIDKLTKRLSGWKAKLLSRAGRLVLASSVLSTIPIFFMSVFKLPVWVIRAIDRIRRDFIWKGTTHQNRGIHLLSWDRMCLPKHLGGFGLINLSLHNISLLLRWWWRMYDKPNSQWASIAKLLYGTPGRMTTPLVWKKSGSFFWTDLRNLRHFFQLSVKTEVHNGEGTLFWYDNWGDTVLRFFGSEHPLSNRYITIKEGLPRFSQLLPSPLSHVENQLYNTAQNIQLSVGTDKLLWRWRADGNFSTASVYKQLVSGGKCSFVFKNIWKLKVPPSVQMFLVFLAHGRILTQDQLFKRHIQFQPKCIMCDLQIIETCDHLFANCTFAQGIWTRMQFNGATITTLLHGICITGAQCRITLAAALWGLWLERNNRTFRNERRSLDMVHQWIVQQATLFKKFCN